MKIHREGYKIIVITLLLLTGLYIPNHIFLKDIIVLYWIVNAILIIMFFLIVQFFRIPNRKKGGGENDVLCPADGKVVAIEEVTENEYLKDKRIQVSIFMSPLNVHAQWYPIGGETTYYKYHRGKYLVAWHPKSSTENERTTVVTKHSSGTEILVRQIAGAVARRIICYAKVGKNVNQIEEMGFIRFGSRVDVFFPADTKIHVKVGQKVRAIETILGKLN